MRTLAIAVVTMLMAFAVPLSARPKRKRKTRLGSY